MLIRFGLYGLVLFAALVPGGTHAAETYYVFGTDPVVPIGACHTCQGKEAETLRCLEDCPLCGDGICSGDEAIDSCAEDCSVCGDGICSGDEAIDSCAQDCSVCGDGICSGDETIDSCAQDCSVCGDGWCTGTETCDSCVYDCCGGECNLGTPPYAPSFWNAGDVQPYNNCYNYSCNVRTDTFAQPGRASGESCGASSCIDAAKISEYARNDGLVQLPPGQECPPDMVKLALVIWTGFDYHWYRQDSDGMWSHKPGRTAATDVDNSGQYIANPETADRGGYDVFAGYFCTCSSDEQGAGPANIY